MKLTVFGEILWDVFEEEQVIGGAPFNFAAHARRLGAEVELVSAVGYDLLGDLALQECRSRGIDTVRIARVDRPTGCCLVSLSEGIPRYELAEDAAYDHIPWEETADPCICRAETSRAVYFGTLAQRSPASAASLMRLLAAGGFEEAFFDINIRQHFYSEEMIQRSLACATILKVSREEIGVLGRGSPEEICAGLAKDFPNLKLIVVTMDADGAFAYDCAAGTITRQAAPPCEVVSTVGAGDAFSAAFLVAYLNGQPVGKCLAKACAWAGRVVSQLGAVPDPA